MAVPAFESKLNWCEAPTTSSKPAFHRQYQEVSFLTF